MNHSWEVCCPKSCQVWLGEGPPSQDAIVALGKIYGSWSLKNASCHPDGDVTRQHPHPGKFESLHLMTSPVAKCLPDTLHGPNRPIKWWVVTYIVNKSGGTIKGRLDLQTLQGIDIVQLKVDFQATCSHDVATSPPPFSGHTHTHTDKFIANPVRNKTVQVNPTWAPWKKRKYGRWPNGIT